LAARPGLKQGVEALPCLGRPDSSVSADDTATADELRTEVELTRGAATILECRAPWREDFGPEWTKRGVARLKYTIKSGLWTPYYSDRNGRWHLHDLSGPTKDIRILLDEVDRDPTCIFWG
jgi:Protein of unknown function (DUF3024)